jgi:phosphoribosylaminoimidazole-succinocarboxamide synthase
MPSRTTFEDITMPDLTTLFETKIKSLSFLHRGKVRDIYMVNDDKLLIVQTDCLSLM